MKKILVLLVSVLSTISVFGQSQLDFSRVNSVTQVGDQLIVKFQYFKDPNMGEATLTQFDFQYNNKLLAYVSHEWQVASTSAQKARNSWNGYKFIEDGQKGVTDYDGQYVSWLSGTASYGADADWSVERITVQDVDGYPHESEFVKYTFTIKDKGVTNYTDYSDLIQANWANYKESDGTQIDVTSGAAGQSLSLTDIKGGDAGNVTLNVFSNVITDNIGDGSHFGYTIYLKSDFDNGVDQNTPVVASGNFDASGQATIQGLVNDTEYHVSVYIDSQQAYLDNAVTVSDLAIIFQEAIGAGNTPNGQTTTFDYAIQKLLGNVVGEMGANTKIDFQDSYEVLGYLQGVTSTNNPRITKTGFALNVSGIKSTFGDKNANGDPTVSGVITPTDNSKIFDFAHTVFGDVNFSHGFKPTSQNAVMSIAQGKTTMSINSARYTPQMVNMDLVSELKDGKVIFYINSNVEGMVGSQFNIVYDRTRLVLDNVVFDTGNTMTNFANHLENEGKINVGSFDQNFESFVKVGTPYKIIFTPIVELNNTSGLVSFKVKEGVKADGTQINFILN
jgi:hypothetical protein